jgi:hypothetical protein
VHKDYDAIYEELLPLLTDPGTFTADVLEDGVWNDNFARLERILNSVDLSGAQQAKVEDFLIDILFIAVDAQDWVDPSAYQEYINLWKKAMNSGFLPDCVCQDGPAPKIKWEVIPPSPKGKGIPRQTPVLPQPIAVIPTMTPVAAIPDTGASSPVLPQPIAVIPAMTPAAAVLGTGANSQAAATALGNFLQGGATGASLPVSINQGTFVQPSVFSLPILANVSNPWVAPVDQLVYDMDKFHQSYVPSDNKMVMNVDGTFTVKSGGKKISSPEEWANAAVNLGHNMAASPSEHQFSWPVFMLWVHLTGLNFKTYSFSSVIEHERAWRKWRRSTRSTWDVQNPILEKMFLVTKLATSSNTTPTKTPNTSSAKTGKSPPCFDFQLTACTRLGSCRFNHVCTKCHTTFPNTSGKCPCVGGSLPPGVTLPAGVTFGK